MFTNWALRPNIEYYYQNINSKYFDNNKYQNTEHWILLSK